MITNHHAVFKIHLRAFRLRGCRSHRRVPGSSTHYRSSLKYEPAAPHMAEERFQIPEDR